MITIKIPNCNRLRTRTNTSGVSTLYMKRSIRVTEEELNAIDGRIYNNYVKPSIVVEITGCDGVGLSVVFDRMF